MIEVVTFGDPNCTKCKLHRQAIEVCVPGTGNLKGDIMVVSRGPDSRRKELEDELSEVGLDTSRVYFTHAIHCRNFDQSASNLDVKTCRPYLDEEISDMGPSWILALGNEALLATTGHSGITKYRGRPIQRGDGISVFPTISLAAVLRNPGQRQAWTADIRLFAAKVNGLDPELAPPKIVYIYTKAKVKKLAQLLQRAQLLSYDIETTGDSEFDARGRIVSLAGTMVLDDRLVCWALPLYHPESPWKRSWRSLLAYLAEPLGSVPKQVAHNGKFDARWLRHFGVPGIRVTFDTLLAAHLLDENRQKGLKPQAASRLGVEPWAINTKDLLKEPIKKVLKYNAFDTYYTYHIYLQLREELLAQPRLARIFAKLLMPANEELIRSESQGIWCDRKRLAERHHIARRTLKDIEAKIMEHVPSEEYWPRDARGRPRSPNFNASIFARWLLFDWLDLPVLERGKEKPDGSPGDPSMREAVLLELKGKHPVVQLMLDRVKWQKYNSSFFEAYEELIDENDRIHTTFKLWGTVTGRLSSGKADAEKVTARRQIRGVNLQQVPRDPFVRGLFGAAPGYTFVEVDFSQVELRIGAFLSRDRTLLHLYQTGQDVHRATASWVLGIPASEVTKEARKKAKAVNFGFLYGMGAKKFVQTAFENYELVVTLDEAQAIRKQFFNQFKGLYPWHARQRRLVHEHARVQSPMGRIRHLPDIRSSDGHVVAEAERQAINSPVQALASDMNLLGMIEVMERFRRQDIEANMLGLVHDATLFEIADDQVGEALRAIKDTYENLPLQRKFGVSIDIPIIADLKVGKYWGDAKELTEEEVMTWQTDTTST